MTALDSADSELLEDGRRVISVEEYGDVKVPAQLLLADARLQLYPELYKTGLVRTYVRDGDLVFQVGGLVGFLPLNENLALEIRPRVPIRNLERVLLLSDVGASIVLANHLRTFSSKDDSSLSYSFLDFIADRLVDLVERCALEGLHYEYVRRRRVGQSPAGRLLPFESSKGQAKGGGRLVLVSEAYERDYDNAPNRCLAVALEMLCKSYRGMRDRAGKRKRIARITRARSKLGKVTAAPPATLLANAAILDPTRLPSSRPSYPDALSVAKIVLSNVGVDLRNRTGRASLPSMLFSLEKAFEGYLRKLLLGEAKTFRVLDGNFDPPGGARRPLFHSVPRDSEYSDSYSTPDIVCETFDSNSRIVLDVKYKPSIDRGDINQVLGYALTYESTTIVLVTPRSGNHGHEGLKLLGKIGEVSVFNYFFDLSAADLALEEQAFTGQIAALIG